MFLKLGVAVAFMGLTITHTHAADLDLHIAKATSEYEINGLEAKFMSRLNPVPKQSTSYWLLAKCNEDEKGSIFVTNIGGNSDIPKQDVKLEIMLSISKSDYISASAVISKVDGNPQIAISSSGQKIGHIIKALYYGNEVTVETFEDESLPFNKFKLSSSSSNDKLAYLARACGV